MMIQTLTRSSNLCLFGKFQILESPPQMAAIHACPTDYGFDFDEDELADELHAQETHSALDQFARVVGVSEFETVYRWFAS
jgi:hypothetical protein